jgi:hypothetical protein
MSSVRLAEEKEPLIHTAFGPQISADQRRSAKQRQRKSAVPFSGQGRLRQIEPLRNFLALFAALC